MIKINEFLQVALKKIEQMKEEEQVIFYTAKKDRLIKVEKHSNELFSIYEEGYVNQVISNVSKNEIKKHLKEMKKQEFPRSRQLWMKYSKKK